jgi:hypothetical protein
VEFGAMTWIIGKINKEAKILRECLDGASRPRMETTIFSMLGCGMMRLEDLENYSQEIHGLAKAWFEHRKSC